MTVSEVPESKVLLVLLLIVDMIISIVRESITIADGDRGSSAVAALSVFGVIGLLFAVVYSIAVVIYVVYLCLDSNGSDDRTKATFKAISLFLGLIGAVLYLYGDNLSFIINNAMELDCDETCILNNRVAAFICLGLALIIFHLIPPILHQCMMVVFDEDPGKEKNPWLLAINMIIVVVKTDMLYSAILQIAGIDYCGTGGEVASAIFVSICIVFAIVALVVNCLHAIVVNNNKSSYLMPFVVCGLILLILCLPLYMLSDNTYPLDCAFGCGPEIEAQNITIIGGFQNATITDVICDQTVNGGVRLGFTLLAFIVITTLSVVYTGFSCTSSKEPIAFPI